eukprot:840531_1
MHCNFLMTNYSSKEARKSLKYLVGLEPLHMHLLKVVTPNNHLILDLKQLFADLRDSHDDTHANDHDHEPLINNDKSTSGFLGCELNLLSTPKPILHRICDFLTNNEVNRFKMVYQTGYRCTAGIVQVTNLCI